MNARSIAAIWLCQLCCLTSSALFAQNMIQQVNRLPSISEARDYLPPAIQLDTYKVRNIALTCTPPDGGLVEISPVTDADEFLFLAIQSKRGRMILANERYIRTKTLAYTVFSFYKECALHSLVAVKSSGPGNHDEYDLALIKGAECLAVQPTKATLGAKVPLSLRDVAQQLRDDNRGAAASTRAELERCSDGKYTSMVAASLVQKNSH